MASYTLPQDYTLLICFHLSKSTRMLGTITFSSSSQRKLGKSVNKSSLLTFGNPQLQGVQRPQSFVIGLCVRTTLPGSLFNLTEIISVQSIRPQQGLKGSKFHIPVCGAYRGLYPNLSRINFLGPSLFRNKFPIPKKGTTPRRTCYTKNIQNQLWDHGGKHLWIKFQWPRPCLSLCKSPTNSVPRNSTLFFGCNPSVAEYFSMGQPP